MADQRVRVTWVKSAIGYADNQKRTIAALGLRRLHQTVEHPEGPAVRGMIATVHHLVVADPSCPAADGEGAAE